MNKIYHLSHIDLDGYGCQYLTKKAFGENLYTYNANYGAEILVRLEEIVKDIKEAGGEGKILITDLNLTVKECNKLLKMIDEHKIKEDITLLDHHQTGINAADTFDWYYLDSSKSATLITYEWLKKNFDFDKENSYKKIVEAINAIDIWVEDSPYFEFGKVLLGMISNAKEINRVLFPKEDNKYKLFLIEKAKEILDKYTPQEAPIIMDDMLHQFKKEFFIENQINNTKDNLVAFYITNLLNSKKEELIIQYKDYKGILGYNIGSSSIIGNRFLIENPEIDFYMDVNSRGTFSLRSNNRVDVAQIAQEIGNGGGHPNASGGKIDNFKDAFVYSQIKEFIQEYLDQKAKENQNG